MERLTEKRKAGVNEIVVHKNCKEEFCGYRHCENCKNQVEVFERLFELENKLEKGLLVEIGYCKDCRFFSPSTPCVKGEETGFCNAYDRGTKGSDKCRGFEPIKRGQIKLYWITKIQSATIRLFCAQDSDYVDGRAVRANEKAISYWLDKITDHEAERRRILDIIERQNWNTEDETFKPICDELRALGYEILEGVK